MKATRTIYSKNLNKSKYKQLEEQAKRLGKIRSQVWHTYGSINGVSIKSDRIIRDAWLKKKRKFNVSANAWKETLRDSFANIKANREAAKEKVRKVIYKQNHDENQKKMLYKLLKSDQWSSDNYLRRKMRKYWKHGRNHTYNQIVVRSDNYTTFLLGGYTWIKIPSLQKAKRIAIPLNTNIEPSGTLRLILIDGIVEVHYTIDIPFEANVFEKNFCLETRKCGTATVGIDKGYTEVFVDSDGKQYGKDLGKILTKKSDKLKQKYQNRNKLRTICNKKPHKKQNIILNNLGRKKLNKQNRKTKSQIKDIIYQATHQLVDKAFEAKVFFQKTLASKFIAAEDLTSPIASKRLGKNVTRRLSAWTKGVIANALDTVSRRRGSSVVLVNSAYTSQVDSRYGILLGRRNGDSFYCHDGVVLQADKNAARNVLARLHDQEIDRWTPYQKVKSILLKRTERHRLGLLNQDSSCTP